MELSSWLVLFAAAYTIISIACFALIGSLSSPQVAAQAVHARPSGLANKSMDSVLLVIAHPDDEAMFFVPSIQHLKQYFHVHVLCLSNGKHAEVQQAPPLQTLLLIQEGLTA